MKKIFFALLASYIVMNSYSIILANNSGLSFLKLGVGGRSLGMGEAYSAIAFDPTATYYNPASLSHSINPKIVLMHKQWIQDMKTEFIGASTLSGDFALGLSINSTSINNIELRSKPGEPIGTFSAHNVSIGLSGAYSFDSSLSIGVTGKFLYEKIYIDDASGYGIDVGCYYSSPWKIPFSFELANIGSMNQLRNESTTLPLMARVGTAYEIPLHSNTTSILIASDILSFLKEKDIHLHAGAEIQYNKIISFRFGYQTGYEAKSFSAGVGINYSILQFDYAFVPFINNLGTTHSISIGLEFK